MSTPTEVKTAPRTVGVSAHDFYQEGLFHGISSVGGAAHAFVENPQTGIVTMYDLSYHGLKFKTSADEVKAHEATQQRLSTHRWIPVSERPPTKEDGFAVFDQRPLVLFLTKNKTPFLNPWDAITEDAGWFTPIPPLPAEPKKATQTKGVLIARENRTECNSLSSEQREYLTNKAMQMVYSPDPLEEVKPSAEWKPKFKRGDKVSLTFDRPRQDCLVVRVPNKPSEQYGIQWGGEEKWWNKSSVFESELESFVEPLPSPAKELVALEAKDVPPGSAIRKKAWADDSWNIVQTVAPSGIFVGNQVFIEWDQLMLEDEILRPGSTEWQPCSKEKQP